ATDYDHRRAAGSAPQKAGQQVFGPAFAPQFRTARPRTAKQRAPSLRRLEQLVRDNGQLGYCLLQPLLRRIAPRLPLARRRIFDEALPVVDQTSSIEPIVDDAIEPQPAAIDRRRIPLAATRTWNLLGVQPRCNSNRRFTAHVLLKDAQHDLGFSLIDRPPAAIVALAHDVIAVALAPECARPSHGQPGLVASFARRRRDRSMR